MSFSYYLCNVFHLETRPKIRKKGENNEFNGLKIMNNDEIRAWKTQSIKHKIAQVLIQDGMPFRFSPAEGIVFFADKEYVDRLIYRLMTSYNVSLEPIIKLYNK